MNSPLNSKGKELPNPNPRAEVSALEQVKTNILTVANQLKVKHRDKYNMAQYKFWAEILENERHKRWNNFPHGLFWGKSKYTCNSSMDAQNMLKSVGDMAKTIATAIKSSTISKEAPADSSVHSSVGILPGKN